LELLDFTRSHTDYITSFIEWYREMLRGREL